MFPDWLLAWWVMNLWRWATWHPNPKPKATEPSWVFQTPSELHEGGGPFLQPRDQVHGWDGGKLLGFHEQAESVTGGSTVSAH